MTDHSESFNVRLWRDMLREGVDVGAVRHMVDSHVHALKQLATSDDVLAAIADSEHFRETLVE